MDYGTQVCMVFNSSYVRKTLKMPNCYSVFAMRIRAANGRDKNVSVTGTHRAWCHTIVRELYDRARLHTDGAIVGLYHRST
jgi:hypothetical protein